MYYIYVYIIYVTYIIHVYIYICVYIYNIYIYEVQNTLQYLKKSLND